MYKAFATPVTGCAHFKTSPHSNADDCASQLSAGQQKLKLDTHLAGTTYGEKTISRL